MSEAAFRPVAGNTKNVSASTTSASVALGLQAVVGQCQVRVHNAAGAAAFVRFGNSAITASATTDFPIPAGGVEVFTVASIDGSALYGAAVLFSGTGSVYFSVGYGL